MDGKETLVPPSAPKLFKDCSTLDIGLVASLNQSKIWGESEGGYSKCFWIFFFWCKLECFKSPPPRIYSPALVSALPRPGLDGDDGCAKSH